MPEQAKKKGTGFDSAEKVFVWLKTRPERQVISEVHKAFGNRPIWAEIDAPKYLETVLSPDKKSVTNMAGLTQLVFHMLHPDKMALPEDPADLMKQEPQEWQTYYQKRLDSNKKTKGTKKPKLTDEEKAAKKAEQAKKREEARKKKAEEAKLAKEKAEAERKAAEEAEFKASVTPEKLKKATFKYMPIDEINLLTNIRGVVEVDDKLLGLRQSIAKDGIVEPVVIDEDNNLLAGYRRLTAAKSIGLTEVPVRVEKSVDAMRQYRIAMVENTMREPLSPVALLRQMVYGHNVLNMTIREVARMVGLNESQVSTYVTAAEKLPQSVLEHIDKNRKDEFALGNIAALAQLMDVSGDDGEKVVMNFVKDAAIKPTVANIKAKADPAKGKVEKAKKEAAAKAKLITESELGASKAVEGVTNDADGVISQKSLESTLTSVCQNLENVLDNMKLIVDDDTYTIASRVCDKLDALLESSREVEEDEGDDE